MSLLLRKECQAILDDNNLPEYHVDITINNHLEIVGECGQPLAVVYGIKFTRKSPGKLEIDYAVELFDAFLAKYKTRIVAYRSAAVKLKARPEVILPEGLRKRQYCSDYSYPVGGFHIVFGVDTKTFKLDENSVQLHHHEDHHTVKALQKFKFNKAELMVNVKAVVELKKYEKDTDTLETLKHELSKCSI